LRTNRERRGALSRRTVLGRGSPSILRSDERLRVRSSRAAKATRRAEVCRTPGSRFHLTSRCRQICLHVADLYPCPDLPARTTNAGMVYKLHCVHWPRQTTASRTGSLIECAAVISRVAAPIFGASAFDCGLADCLH
jgi:hypothetical protein